MTFPVNDYHATHNKHANFFFPSVFPKLYATGSIFTTTTYKHGECLLWSRHCFFFLSLVSYRILETRLAATLVTGLHTRGDNGAPGVTCSENPAGVVGRMRPWKSRPALPLLTAEMLSTWHQLEVELSDFCVSSPCSSCFLISSWSFDQTLSYLTLSVLTFWLAKSSRVRVSSSV